MSTPPRKLDKLVSLSSAPLLPPFAPTADGGLLARGRRASELRALLAARNGFYAFESALHVFPLGRAAGVMDLETWNSDALWRGEYGDQTEGCLFFAEDVFGCQFCLRDEQVFTFDPETGELQEMAADLEDWAGQLLADYEVLTGHPLAHAWQSQRGPLPPGKRLVPGIPFVCGGEFELNNLLLLDAVKGMHVRANLARQIRDLPDGARIEFKIVD
jgi:hypothetical protein